MADFEKWVNELQSEIDKLRRKVNGGGASGGGVTIGTVPTVFPSNPSEGDMHALVDGNGKLNALYRYDGESWTQLTGFNYGTGQIATIISGYGLFDTIASSVAGELYYNISNQGYQLRSGGGNFVSCLYVSEPIIFDTSIITGIRLTGKFRGQSFDITVDITEAITSGYCGCLCICYHTDNDGNWVTWQVCRPYFIETNNNALPQGTIIAKQSGASGDFIITGLELIKAV